MVLYIYHQTSSIAVKRYTVEIKGLPESLNGYTILHLNDLHNKDYGEELINLIKKQHFDIVAFTGDIIDKRTPDIKPPVKLLKGIKNKPVYFVTGNHEWWAKYPYRKSLESHGVNILDNRAVKIATGGEHFWLLGVDDPHTGRDRLGKALKSVADNNPKILLAHAPRIFDEAVNSNIDLVLVGHTHGGQIRLPFVGAVVAPGQGFFPKYDYGLYSSDSTRMIINGGVGESVFPIRFNMKPEIILVKLVPSN